MKDLNERTLEAWNFKAILDASNQPNRVNLCANIFQEAPDESCEETELEREGVYNEKIYLTRPCLGISQKVFPEIVIVLFLRKVYGLRKHSACHAD